MWRPRVTVKEMAETASIPPHLWQVMVCDVPCTMYHAYHARVRAYCCPCNRQGDCRNGIDLSACLAGGDFVQHRVPHVRFHAYYCSVLLEQVCLFLEVEKCYFVYNEELRTTGFVFVPIHSV